MRANSSSIRFACRLKPFISLPEVAPLAGVFFLLVIFLLLHSYLVPPPGIRIQLPAASASPSLPGTRNPLLVVTVDRDEHVYFDHQLMPEAELRARLTARVRQSREALTLLVQADEAVHHAAVVRLASLARDTGIREVIFETRPPLFSPKPGVK